MNQSEKLNLAYPNAVFCAIALKGAPVNGHNGCSKYELSRACLEAANLKLPPIHDFNLERSIISKAEDPKTRKLGNGINLRSDSQNPQGLETSFSNIKVDSLTSDQRDKLENLKTITNANESVCLALLEENKFDVARSVDAFYRLG